MDDLPKTEPVSGNPFTQVPIEITISVGKARPLVRELLRAMTESGVWVV